MRKNKVLALILVAAMIVSGVSYNLSFGLFDVNAQNDGIQLENNLVNYVTVQTPQASLDTTQVVTVGVGNRELDPKDAFIKYVNEATGEEYTAAATNRVDDAFVFEFGFSGCKEGSYRLVSMAYKLNDEVYSVVFKDAGFDVTWGVGIKVETNNDAEVVKDSTDNTASNNDMVYTVTTADSTYTAPKLSEAVNKAKESVASNNSKGSASNGDIVVVLDPGHGGSDSGACANGLVEKDLTLKVALICQSILMSEYSGVQVFTTRSDDSYVGLEDRIAIAQFWHADMFISIHFNSAGGNPQGAEVYYPNANYNYGAHVSGAIMAQSILNNLTSLGLVDRGIKIRNSQTGTTYPDGSLADYYSVIRNGKNAGIPSIIVEHAFLEGDAWMLQNDMFILALGIADAKGIAQAYNLGGAWKPTGLYVHEHVCDNITVGMCVDNKYTDLDYRWQTYDVSTGKWELASDWTTNNPWLMWNPGKTGDYLIHGEVRQTNNPSRYYSFDMGFHHNQYINSICAMPNPYGYGILLGEETQYSNSNYRYEIQILDCNKYIHGDPNPWVYSSGKNMADKTYWTAAGVPNGYFWTLYRVYDTAGNQLDEQCWGFAY